MQRDSILTWVFRKWWLVVLLCGGGLLQGYFIFKKYPPFKHGMPWNIPAFKSLTINSRIDTITNYSRGYPRVVLHDGRNILLKLTHAGKKYVRVGDSIVKEPRTDSVLVFRQYPTYTEVHLFGHGEDYGANDLDYPYSGLLQRYRIPKKQ